jgi:nitrite reductase/ring-hydroxylating ferredoxin subunit
MVKLFSFAAILFLISVNNAFAYTPKAENISLDVTGFTGNLTATDNTVQKLADAFDAYSGGSGVAVSTYCPNIIHIGGDVFVASGTFCPIYGATYRVQTSTWEITGVEFYNLTTSSWSYTTYNLAYSSASGSATTWEYVVSYNVEVTTVTKSSGMIAVSKNIPPGSFLALHVTRIPPSGTLPTEFGVCVRYKKVD